MNCTLRSHIAPSSKKAFGLFISALLLFAIACVSRQPFRFLIPDGYVGWVLIEFKVKGARPPGEEAGYLVFNVPHSGRLAVPGEPGYGWARDEYYYVDEQGKLEELPITAPGGGGLIWGGGTGSFEEEGTLLVTYQSFFVGPEEEFKRAPRVAPVLRTRHP